MKRYLAFLTLVATTALATAPSTSTDLTVTTTSAAYFVPVGYIELVCTSPTYYAMETTSAGTALTTDSLHPGPRVVNGVTLPRSRWINVSAGTQYLALLLKGGVQGYCMVTQYSVDGVAGSFTTLTVSSTSTLTGNVSMGGTLAVTGASTLTGAVTMSGAATVGTTLGVTGATTLSSTLGVTGITTLSAYTGGQDAGFHNIVTSGSFSNVGDNITGGGTKTRGTGALNNASPSVFTATVNTGAICVCSNNTTQTTPVKCAVSGTTLTITGPNTTTDTVSYICMQ